MNKTISKLVATVTLTSLLATSVMANDTLSRIVSDAQDGKEISIELAKAISNSEISKSDLSEYLKENTSPKTYKELTKAIKSGDTSMVAEAITKSEGANFTSSCEISNSVTATLAVVAGAALVYSFFAGGGPNEYELQQPGQLQLQKDYLVSEMNALIASGNNQFLVQQHQTDIANLDRQIADAKANIVDMQNLDKKAKSVGTIGLVVGAGAAVSALITEKACH